MSKNIASVGISNSKNIAPVGISNSKNIVPVGISNKHAHLSKKHIDELFGKGFALTYLRDIKQPDEFVSEQTIDVIGPKGVLDQVRVLGPVREESQVEITITNAITLGIQWDVRISKDLKGTSGITLRGPHGEAYLEEGVIVPVRHLHASPKEAEDLGLSEGQCISARTLEGSRRVTFHDIIVRIDPLFALELHLDTDEANAAAIKKGDFVELLVNR